MQSRATTSADTWEHPVQPHMQRRIYEPRAKQLGLVFSKIMSVADSTMRSLLPPTQTIPAAATSGLICSQSRQDLLPARFTSLAHPSRKTLSGHGRKDCVNGVRPPSRDYQSPYPQVARGMATLLTPQIVRLPTNSDRKSRHLPEELGNTPTTIGCTPIEGHGKRPTNLRQALPPGDMLHSHKTLPGSGRKKECVNAGKAHKPLLLLPPTQTLPAAATSGLICSQSRQDLLPARFTSLAHPSRKTLSGHGRKDCVNGVRPPSRDYRSPYSQVARGMATLVTSQIFRRQLIWTEKIGTFLKIW